MMSDNWTPGCDVKVDVPNDQKGRHHDVFEEAAAFAQVLTYQGLLKAIQEQVRFARARFGQYDLIDFVVVLIGYALSGEPTLVNTCGSVWTSPMGPFFLYSWRAFAQRLPHNRDVSAALSCQPPPLSAICGGLNEMVLCGSCMPHVLATVAPARGWHSVKRAAPPSNRDE
jgi:hypothetical protein